MKAWGVRRYMAMIPVLAGLSLSVARGAGEVVKIREALPVPNVIRARFINNGLAVLDPFNVEAMETPGKSPAAVPAAEVPDPLKGAAFYDLLPLYARRGFHPAAGTVALFEPESRYIYLEAGAADMKALRAFASWPLEVWKEDVQGGGRQVTLSVETWIVPTSGAGDWKFQPVTPAEFRALPLEARRLAGRQTVLVRSGLRSKVSSSNSSGRGTSGRMVTETEINYGEDGTIECNLAIDFRSTTTEGKTWEAETQYTVVVEDGQPWLVESWAVPGNPPERVFFILQADLRDEYPRENRNRWLAGRMPAGDTCYRAWYIPSGINAYRGPEEESRAAPAKIPDTSGMFGRLPVFNVTDMFARDLGLKLSPGAEFYFCGPYSVLFFRGTREDLKATEALDLGVRMPPGEGQVNVRAFQTKHPETAAPGDGEAGEIGRLFLPVRGGAVSSARLKIMKPGNPGNGDEDFDWVLSLDAVPYRYDVQPGERDMPHWEAAFRSFTGPPYSTQNNEKGDIKKDTWKLPHRHAAGISPDGRSVVMLADVIPTPPPKGNPSRPVQEWWERTGAEDKEGKEAGKLPPK